MATRSILKAKGINSADLEIGKNSETDIIPVVFPISSTKTTEKKPINIPILKWTKNSFVNVSPYAWKPLLSRYFELRYKTDISITTAPINCK